MSIAIKQQLQQQKQHQQGQYLQLFHKANKKEQSTEPSTHTLPSAEWCRKKSIEIENKAQEKKHVTQEINSKRLVRQKIPVAIIGTEEKPPGDKPNPHSEQADIKRAANALETTYCNEEGEPKDYRIYQNGQVNDFFRHDQLQKPSKVSEICLVNDHYILVKMADDIKESEMKNSMTLAATRRREFRALKENQERRSSEIKHSGNKKLCRYLRSKQNRITRIAPIREEPEDQSDFDSKSLKTQSKLDCLKLPYCWQANEQEVETYETCTKICKDTQNIIGQKFPATEINSPIKLLDKEECCKDYKNQDIQTISGSILKSSLQYQVTLHNYGSLVDSQNINNKTLQFNNTSRRKCPRLESFYWLLRPFRGRYRKPKPKIQAVVYKTYFVKWTKPPDTLSHGYGVKPSRSKEIEVSVLRRCRSAIF